MFKQGALEFPWSVRNVWEASVGHEALQAKQRVII